MSETYLQEWCTADEACIWLKYKTGQHWSPSRLLESGVTAAFHLVPDDVSNEEFLAVFGGKWGGVMAVLSQSDVPRFATAPEYVPITVFSPEGGPVFRFPWPLDVPLAELRFKRGSLLSIADRMAQGAQFAEPPGPLTVTLPDGEVVSFSNYPIELHGLPVRIEKMNFETIPVEGHETVEYDFAMLATRGQLIESFGRFTGMNASWFSNIKDSPALLAARKVTGQGGRGHIKEPWFCPFEVMRWLANPKRRKGTKLSEEKAWELLEKSFPTVYNTHSVADPRQAS